MSNEYKDWYNDFSENQKKNYKLCMKYPIIIPNVSWIANDEDNYQYEYTMLDSIPIGWRIAFGEEWAKEIQEAIYKIPEEDRDNIYILQLKEKYGVFTQYFSHYTDELYKVIHKYEDLSKKTCINCGTPATKISLGWISPYCSDCSKKIAKHDRLVDINKWFTED